MIKYTKRAKFCLLFTVLSLLISISFAQTKKSRGIAASEQDFLNPGNQAKPWVFFWWFNGYVDKPAITHHLEELKAKGFGGFLLYPSESGSIPQGAPFMSPEWRELFRFAVSEAHRLGLQMGINICNGWPAGGPCITPENNTRIFVSATETVKGPQLLSGQLPQPLGVNRIYHDVVVQAVPLTDTIPSHLVKITASNDQQDIVNITDGNYFTKWTGQNAGGESISPEHPQWLQYEYDDIETFNYIWIGATLFCNPSLFDIQRSDDGVHFTTVASLHSDYIDEFNGSFPEVKARFIRILFKASGANPNSFNISEMAIGAKPDVMRVMQLEAKRAQNNPMGVTSTRSSAQLAMVWDKLTPLATDRPIAQNKILDITQYCTTDGKINWQVPPGNWKIIRIGQTNNEVGAGGGLLVDYLNPAASNQHFNKFMKLLIQDAGPYAGTTFKYFHEDNNEIDGIYNWTGDFVQKFTQLRGYDPRPYLSALSGELVGSVETTDRFLFDYRHTIADLIASSHFQLLKDSAKKYNVNTEGEAGGSYLPFPHYQDALKNQGIMDIPVAEFWESSNWKESQFDQNGEMTHQWIEGAQDVDAKTAASAGHLYGKKIIAAESFTSLGPNSHWRIGPGDLLLQANIAYCEGINRFTLHSSTTTKAKDGKPGYEYDAGTHFNPNVTWWKDVAPFVKFISRCDEMLQRGQFAADVLYYNGDDIPNIAPPKHIPDDLGPGYDYDVCNTEILLTKLSVKNGMLVTADGTHYRLLVLPATNSFNLSALKKIHQLVNAGATIIGQKPDKATGLYNYSKNDEEVKKLAVELWGNCDGSSITENKLGKGRVFWGKSAKQVLAEDNIPPDFTERTDDVNALIDYIHRQDGNTEIYFVANRRNTTVTVNCTFRVAGKQPELWDPFTGKNSVAKAFTQKNGLTAMPIELSPYGSTFVVFRKGIPVTQRGTMLANNPTFILKKELKGPYHVSFDTTWGGPKSVVFDKLDDWSKRTEEGIRYFSGTARYSKKFDSRQLMGNINSEPLVIDFGDIKNTAHVWLNGKDLGILWAPPYRVDISKAVKPGINDLEIYVTNTWVNRLTGDSRLPVAERRTKTNIRFSPDTPLTPSGLLGPVTLGVYQYK